MVSRARFRVFTLVLLLVASGCSTVDKKRRDFQNRLQLATAATIYEAAAYELKNDPAGAALAKRVDPKQIVKAFESRNIVRVNELFTQIKSEIERSYRLSAEERSSLSASIDSARLYLGLPDELITKELKLQYALTPLPSDLTQTQDWSEEVQKADTSKADWNGINEYVSSRLGPITAAMEKLTSQDTLLISNLTIEEIVSRHRGAVSIELLTLPISSYEKKIYWMTFESGDHWLVVTEVKGTVFLRHLQMLMKRELERKGLVPHVIVEEAKSRNEKLYASLASFWSQRSVQLGKVKAVIFGYAGRYRSLI